MHQCRGGSTGWDWQKGLPAADQDLLAKENVKTHAPTLGDAQFAITKVRPVRRRGRGWGTGGGGGVIRRTKNTFS